MSQDQLSGRQLANISWELKRLMRHFQGVTVAELTVPSLIAYLEIGATAAKSYNNRRGVLSTLFKYAFHRDWIAENPIPKIPVRRMRRKRGMASTLSSGAGQRTNGEDALRHIVATQDPLQRTTFFEHCVCGALIGIIDSAGHRTAFNRDLQQRLTQKAFADGTSISLRYENTTSRIKSRTDQNGQIRSYTYNEDNSIRTTSYSNALATTPSVNYTYDAYYPRLVTMSDGVGTTSYNYNQITSAPTLGAGRLGSVSGPLSNSVVSFAYDSLGRMSSASVNGSANFSSWVFDALGRISSVTNPLGQFIYQYVDQTERLGKLAFPNGQVTNISYYSGAPSDGSGDGDQRLDAIQNLNPNATNLSTFSYSYDSDGEIMTWSKRLDTGTPYSSTFNYDAASQLTSATVSNPSTQTTQGFFYAYDTAGNRTQEQIDSSINTSAFNSTNEYGSETAGGSMTFAGTVSEPATVTIGGNVATVDSFNNWRGSAAVTVGANLIPLTAHDTYGDLITKNINVTVSGGPNRSLTYDANGNLTNNGAGQAYQWDAENRLVETSFSASGTTGFVYDGEGHKVQETFNGNVSKQWVIVRESSL